MSKKSKSARRSPTVAALLSGTAPGEGRHELTRPETRQAAREAWARERVAALRRADAALMAARMKLIEPYLNSPDEMPNLPEPPEKAERDAIMAEIKAVIDDDRWPRHLHWSL